MQSCYSKTITKVFISCVNLKHMPPPNDSILRTVADELFELVKRSKKISVEEAAKRLKMPLSNIQALVDFLVEERIFGIEYKFTTPYVYLYKEGVSKAKKESGLTKEIIAKEQFYKMAKEKTVPYERIEGLWRKYLQQNIGYIRREFWRKAKEREISEEKIGELWKKYLAYL